jgi:hypothetical protein
MSVRRKAGKEQRHACFSGRCERVLNSGRRLRFGRAAAVNAPRLVALVPSGAVFKNGKLIERPDESEGGDQQVA